MNPEFRQLLLQLQGNQTLSNDSNPTTTTNLTWITILQTILITIIVGGTIIGNGLVLLVMTLSGDKSLRSSSTHYFITNLAMADFLIGILCLPFKATLTISGGTWYFGSAYCTFWEYMHFWLCSVSILSVVVICADRYVGVSYPLKHHRFMNKKNIGIIIGSVWMIGLSLSAIPLAVWPEPPASAEQSSSNKANIFTPANKKYTCQINQQRGHVLIASIGILYIPTIIMIILYWKIYMITCAHFKNLRDGFANSRKNNDFQIEVRLDGTVEESTTNNVSFTTINTNILGDDEDNDDDSPSSSIDYETKSKALNKSNKPNNNRKMSSTNSTSSSSTTTTYKLRGARNNVKHEHDRLTLHRARQIRVAKRLALIVGIFILAYFPYFTIFLIRGLNKNLISKDVFSFTSWIRYFNSFLNPILYAAMIPAFTKSFKNLFLCNFNK